ncbi:MAG: hypothetical protein RLZZ535_810 [Cyanobacteriota bacterium]
MKATAIQVAISEILEPQLGVTEQVLAVHRLTKLDGEFVPLDAHENSEAGKYFIYFGIEDEPYYFVIVVENRKEGFACSTSYIEAAVRVYLCITSLTLDPEMISQRIELTPTRSRMIGEPQHPKTPCLIVEVLSDSTEAYDRGKKFEKYRRNPNLVDYVLVSSDEMAIDIYHRNDAGDWLILSYRAGDLVEFKSISLSLAIEQFYEEIVFEQQSEIS